MTQNVNYVRTQVEPLASRFIVRLDREISEAYYFQEELATIRAATANDIIHILINCEGGMIKTAKAFLSALAQTEAHVITEIEGEACSAATLIFLAGHEHLVSDDAEFMIHTSSYGYGGKESNVRQYVEHQAKATDRLLRKYYKHFLTEEEIDDVIKGRDLWMDADEIMERLEKRQQLVAEEHEAGEENITPELIRDLHKEEGIDGVISYLFGEQLPEEDILPDNKATEEGKVVFQSGDLQVNFMPTEDKKDGVFQVLDCDVGVGEAPFTDSDLHKVLYDFKMKEVADSFGIGYAHNISPEKLSERIKKFVIEHYEEF